MAGGLNIRIQSCRVASGFDQRGQGEGGGSLTDRLGKLPPDIFESPCRGLAMKAKGTGAREMRRESMLEPNPSSCWICGSQRARGTPTRQAGERPALQIPPRDGRSKAMIVADRSNRAPCNFRFRCTKAPLDAAVESEGPVVVPFRALADFRLPVNNGNSATVTPRGPARSRSPFDAERLSLQASVI